jgi:hypothetical protein
MVGLLCLVSQCATLYIAGWTWAVFTLCSGDVYDFYSVSPEYFGYTLVIELCVRVILFVCVFGNLMQLPTTKSSFDAIIFLVAGL